MSQQHPGEGDPSQKFVDKIDSGAVLPEQVDLPKQEKNTKVLREFVLPDQTEELDFHKLLEGPLFRSYYLSPPGGDTSFKNLVFDSSQPFNGVKSRTFEEIEIIKEASGDAIKKELAVEPISLNEWRYLFSKLTREQLYGVTFYDVQFDDGKIRTIKVTLTNDGEGPYGYSLSFGKVSADTVRVLPLKTGPYTNLKPRIVAPKK